MKVALTLPLGKRSTSSELAERYGFELLPLHVLELVPRGCEEIRAQVGELEGYDWVVLTSAYGVEVMHRCFGAELSRVRLACVGAKTAEALRRLGVSPSLVPEEYRGAALAEALREVGAGSRVLLARASAGGEELAERLRSFAEVVEVHIYDTRLPERLESVHRFMEHLARGELAGVVFTSPLSVEHLLRVAPEAVEHLRKLPVVAIAPSTREALERRGILARMPARYTVEECFRLLRGMLDEQSGSVATLL